MYYDFQHLSGHEVYKLVTSTITPRPIAWVVTVDAQGRRNAAPFSFFNVLSGDPPLICLGIGKRPSGTPKDTLQNILERREFVIHLVNEALVEAMNVTAIEFEPEIDEVEMAGLATAPCRKVGVPRLVDCPVAFECVLEQSVDLGQQRCILVGRLLALHIADDCLLDPSRHLVDTPRLQLVGRMHGAGWYVRCRDLFRLDRISVDQWATQSEKSSESDC